MRYREHKNETGTQGASQTRYQPISIWHQDNRPIAAGFGVEVASHGGGCANLHMLLATPNAIYAECGSLKGRPSTLEALRLVNGHILAPEMPGMGTELRPDFIRQYKVS